MAKGFSGVGSSNLRSVFLNFFIDHFFLNKGLFFYEKNFFFAGVERRGFGVEKLEFGVSSLSRREESCKHKLFACLLAWLLACVSAEGQKNIRVDRRVIGDEEFKSDVSFYYLWY